MRVSIDMLLGNSGLVQARLAGAAIWLIGCSAPVGPFSVHEALTLGPGNYRNPVLVEGQISRPYGLLLRDTKCKVYCRDILSLVPANKVGEDKNFLKLARYTYLYPEYSSKKVIVVVRVNIIYGDSKSTPNGEITKIAKTAELVEIVKISVDNR